MDAIIAFGSASFFYGAAVEGGGLVEAGVRKREALRAILRLVYHTED